MVRTPGGDHQVIAPTVTRREVRRLAWRLAAYVALACTPMLARAQTSLVEDWRWVRFGVAEGLPSPVVHEVVRGTDGTMWAATDRGPAWFDGYRWQGVRDESGRALTSERAHFVSAGAGGVVLFAAQGTIYRVDARAQPAHPLPAFAQEVQSWSRVAVSRDGLWAIVVVADRLKLRRLSGDRWVEEPWPGELPRQSYNAKLHVGEKGRLLLSVGAALWERRDRAWIPVPPFLGGRGNISRVVQNAAGEERVVVASPDPVQGVWARGPSVGPRWTQFPEFGSESPAAFDIGSDGSAVGILDAGDFMYCDTQGWRRLIAPQFLATASSAAFDANGDVWFGTRSGVVLWRRKSERWTQWRVAASQPVNRVNGVAVAMNGDVVAATAGGVAFPEADGKLRVDGGLPTVPFTAIAWARGHRLWAGSGGSFSGVYQQTASGWTLRTDAPGLSRAGIHRIVQGRDSSLWLLGLPVGRNGRGGVWHVEGNRIQAIALPESVDTARFYDFAEDTSGVRWIATDKGVLHSVGGAFQLMRAYPPPENDVAFSLALGDSGCVWVGLRSHGIIRIRRDLSFESTATIGPAPSGQVTVARADDGSLWATSPDGIWVRVGSSWSLLTRTFGLPTQAVWPIASAGSDIYVGTLGAGLLRLRLDELRDAEPRVLISAPRLEEGVLMLRWGVSTERGIVAPEDVASRWRVDDGEWSAWSGTTSVVAPMRMPWRRHVLSVEARTPLGVRTVEPTLEPFVVPPPGWWRRAMLVPLAGLLGLLAWLSVLLVRRRRLQEILSRRVREAERLELAGSFAAGMAHELNNLLTTILVNAEIIEHESPDSDDPGPVDEIRKAALRAAGQVRSVLTFTHDRSLVLLAIDLSDLLRRQRASLGAQFPSDVALEWLVPDEPVIVRAEPNGVAAMLRALAENAVEAMGPRGTFTLSLAVVSLSSLRQSQLGLAAAPSYAAVRVSDTGLGMTDAQRARAFEPYYSTRNRAGLGLPLVYAFARRFNGAVEIGEGAAVGTTICLYFAVDAGASA